MPAASHHPDPSGMPPSDPSLSAALSTARLNYELQGLVEDDLAVTPLEQFHQWYDRAVSAGVPEPNAISLATVDGLGRPSVRTVLLKGADGEGFTFFTNYSSRKGAELATHPSAAFVVPWITLQRQVAVRGDVERVSREDSQAYFGSRPYGSRIGAWASHQSQPVASRAELEQRWTAFAEQYPDTGAPDDVPLPEHWGGFRVRPFEIEFWQGRSSRMHDRLVFVGTAEHPRLDDKAAWRVERREP